MSDDKEEFADEEPETAAEPLGSVWDLPGSEPRLLESKEIPTAEIAELPNIRQSYHGIEGLAETMHLNGQLQPCWIRPSLGDHGLPYELIFGYRRKKAAELLNEQGVDGWQTIRCEVREVADGEELSKVIVENFQREQPSAVAEARAMQQLKDQFGMSNKEIANKLGCDPSQVSHRLSLLKLAVPEPTIAALLPEPEISPSAGDSSISPALAPALPEKDLSEEEAIAYADQFDAAAGASKPAKAKPAVDILDMVEKGEISASVAEVITTVKARAQQEKLAELAKKNSWNVKKASSWAKNVEENVVSEEELTLDDLNMVQIEDVRELPRLRPRDNLSKEDYERLGLYTLLRNGMDREILDYLHERLTTPYEALWNYVERLPLEEVTALKERMLRRYIGSAHRFSSLEAELRQKMGTVELIPPPSYDDEIDLPSAFDDDSEFEELLGLPEVED